MRKFKTEQRQNLRYVVKGTLKREEMGDCVLYDTNDKLVGWLGVGPVFPYLAYHSSVPEASIDWGLPILIRDGPFCWRWTIKTKGRHDDMPTCFPSSPGLILPFTLEKSSARFSIPRSQA